MGKNRRLEAIVTEKRRSGDAALREIGVSDRQENGRWFNNRADNSHLPFRRHDQAVPRFRRMRSLEKFTAVHASISSPINQEHSVSGR